MDATSATRRSMVTICSPDAARMADSRWLRRRASRLDIGHDVVSPRQICPHPTPKSNSAKNYLFVGRDAGGQRAAVIYTIAETAKLNALDPEAYIAAVLDRLAGGHPIGRIDELLPWNFKANRQPA